MDSETSRSEKSQDSATSSSENQAEEIASSTEAGANYRFGIDSIEGNGAKGNGGTAGTRANSSTQAEPARDGRAPTETAGQPDSMSRDEGPTSEPTVVRNTSGFKMLDTVLDEPPRETVTRRRFKQHMFFDLVLGFGLLIAVGGFTIGMMRIYVTHMAKQSITAHNYKAAITILRKNPVPEFFLGLGAENPNELLNQALYLDAMEKLDANPDDQSALSQLGRITPGSRFFHLAQEILDKNSAPADLKLHGSTSHFASPEEMKVPDKRPLLEELKKDLGN